MQCGPFYDKPHGFRRKISGYNAEIMYIDQYLLVIIISMEMRRIMILDIHANHYTVKSAYLRHQKHLIYKI